MATAMGITPLLLNEWAWSRELADSTLEC
jgi:hypothetical protein